MFYADNLIEAWTDRLWNQQFEEEEEYSYEEIEAMKEAAAEDAAFDMGLI